MSMQCEPQLREEQAIEILLRNIRGAIAPHLRGFEIKTFEILLAKVSALQSVIPYDFPEQKPPRTDRMQKVGAIQVTKKGYKPNKAKEVAVAEVAAKPSSLQSKASLKERSNNKYTFRKDVVPSLFKILLKNGLVLPEPKRPDQVNKVDDPRYCPFHRCLGHTIEDCFVFKDFVEDKIQKGEMDIAPKYKLPEPSVHMVQGGQQQLVPFQNVFPKVSIRMVQHSTGETKFSEEIRKLAQLLEDKDKHIVCLKTIIVEKDQTIKELTAQVESLKKSAPSSSGKAAKPKEEGVTTKENMSEFTKPTPDKTSFKNRENVLYSFKVEAVKPLFYKMLKCGLRLPEIKRPEEADQVEHPNYCPYHRQLGHTIEGCFGFQNTLEKSYRNNKFKIAKQYLLSEDTVSGHVAPTKVTMPKTELDPAKSRQNKGKSHVSCNTHRQPTTAMDGIPIGLYVSGSESSDNEQIIYKPPNTARNHDSKSTATAESTKLEEQLRNLKIAENDSLKPRVQSTSSSSSRDVPRVKGETDKSEVRNVDLSSHFLPPTTHKSIKRRQSPSEMQDHMPKSYQQVWETREGASENKKRTRLCSPDEE